MTKCYAVHREQIQMDYLDDPVVRLACFSILIGVGIAVIVRSCSWYFLIIALISGFVLFSISMTTIGILKREGIDSICKEDANMVFKATCACLKFTVTFMRDVETRYAGFSTTHTLFPSWLFK